jgi:hypothetical protein
MAAPTSIQRLDRNARKLLPSLTALLLGLLVVVPIGIPQWGRLAPPLMLVAVYYWSLSRPGLMPPSAAFVLGLFQDLLTGAPLGSGALILVLVQWILRSQQRASRRSSLAPPFSNGSSMRCSRLRWRRFPKAWCGPCWGLSCSRWWPVWS